MAVFMANNLIFRSLVVTSILMVIIFVFIKSNRSPLPVMGQIKNFQLTNQKGDSFQSQKLQNSVWVSNFIFTSCQGICPVLSQHLVKLQHKYANKNFNLVSISVDPENDSPEELSSFAKRFKAKTSNWHFLTGAKNNIKEVLEKNFKIGFTDDPTAHSDRIVLMDKSSRIRGYYSLSDAQSMKKLDIDSSRLLHE